MYRIVKGLLNYLGRKDMYRKFSLFDGNLEDYKKGNFMVRFLNFSPTFISDTEVHKRINDMYIVFKGKGKVLLSNKYIGGTEIEEGEIRKCEIIEPEEINIKEGDVLIILAGICHQLKVESENLTLVIVKIPKN
jgi:mannose-6-phosphate isomerase-like protein (cupin superfamily)